MATKLHTVVSLFSPSKESREDVAARVIQRSYRGFIARKNALLAVFTSSWKVLDVAEENQVVQRTDALLSIEEAIKKLRPNVFAPHEHISSSTSSLLTGSAPSITSAPPTSQSTSSLLPSVPSSGKQPTSPTRQQIPAITSPTEATDSLPWPPTKESFDKVLELYKADQSLKRATMQRIYEEIFKVLNKERNISKIRLQHKGETEKKTLVVVGDLHGQLLDLLTILALNGTPSETQLYLFNGDFVDRGGQGVEVLTILYLMKLIWPRSVFLNRGNHENRRLNFKYDFQSQVLHRYDMSLFNVIQETFRMLPLCALVDKKVFVVHGGLFEFDDVTLREIKKINRKRELPRHKEIKTREDKIMEQMLWSDPKEGSGVESSGRGAGVLFGPDSTSAFLKKNNLTLIVRSHEMIEDGLQYHHSGDLVTVFSASNYCGVNSNRGAVLVFSHTVESPSGSAPWFNPKQYYAGLSILGIAQSPRGGTGSGFLRSSGGTPGSAIRCQDVTIQMLRVMIHENRYPLFRAFSRRSEERQLSEGKVTRLEWASVMLEVLRVSLPWLRLLPFLAQLDDDKMVNYLEFLDRYKIKVDEANKSLKKEWQKKIVHSICSRVYSSNQNIFSAFKECDTNNDGRLSFDELLIWLKKYDIGITDEQAYELMRFLDLHKTGFVELDEFVGRFQVEYAHISTLERSKAEDTVWLHEAIQYIGQKMHDRTAQSSSSKDLTDTEDHHHHHRSVRSAFRKAFKKRTPHTITHKDFSRLLKAQFGSRYRKSQRMKLAEFLDQDRDGFICWTEFKTAFQVRLTSADVHQWASSLLERICSFFFHNSVELKYAFRLFDTDNSGKIDKNELRVALEALNFLNQEEENEKDEGEEKSSKSDHQLSEVQLSKLFKLIDSDSDGLIDYNDFLQSFQIIDSKEDMAASGSTSTETSSSSSSNSSSSSSSSSPQHKEKKQKRSKE